MVSKLFSAQFIELNHSQTESYCILMCVFCKYKTSLALQANDQTIKQEEEEDLIIYLAAIYTCERK